jgi:hypothetical protein
MFVSNATVVGKRNHLMGGAQLATMTFFAPTSFAIWIISFEVVPRTMESEAVCQGKT